ncbi:MAG: transcriptional repressor [Sphingomonas sp.]
MAEPPPRYGPLQERVLRLVEDARRPLRGLELVEGIRREGAAVAPSLVFRAIRTLADRGAIRKVHVDRSYTPGSGTSRVTLFCRQCGSVTEVACDAAFEGLDAVAAANGFVVSRSIVEVPGICARCAR